MVHWSLYFGLMRLPRDCNRISLVETIESPGQTDHAPGPVALHQPCQVGWRSKVMTVSVHLPKLQTVSIEVISTAVEAGMVDDVAPRKRMQRTG